MELLKGALRGSSLIGFFAEANDSYCIFPPGEISKVFEKALKVEMFRTVVGHSHLVGLFCTGNSRCLLVPYNTEEKIPVRHEKLKVKETALGNLILCNDNGAIISEKLGIVKASIEKALGVPAVVSTVAGQDLVGSLAFCTNRGAIACPDITEEEAAVIRDVLKVKLDVSTVNMGSPHVGSGMIANCNGAVIGEMCSVHELVRIQETLSD